MSKLPEHPKHPERICWGCEKYCPADDMCCGNGTIRAPHPVELFGDDWLQWLTERENEEAPVGGSDSPVTSQSTSVR
jgi:Protein of unknown function (DUF3079)